MTFREIDRGWRDFKRTLKQLEQTEIVAGLLDGEQATIGLYNEKGTSRAPARPFMAITERRLRPDIGDRVASAVGRVIDFNDMQQLESVGKYYARQIQKTIRSNVPPPNAESTLRRKQARSRKTLIDYGNMLRGVTSAVRRRTVD